MKAKLTRYKGLMFLFFLCLIIIPFSYILYLLSHNLPYTETTLVDCIKNETLLDDTNSSLMKLEDLIIIPKNVTILSKGFDVPNTLLLTAGGFLDNQGNIVISANALKKTFTDMKINLDNLKASEDACVATIEALREHQNKHIPTQINLPKDAYTIAVWGLRVGIIGLVLSIFGMIPDWVNFNNNRKTGRLRK